MRTPSGTSTAVTPPEPPKGSWRRAPVGDDLHAASSAAVGGQPLAALESPLDVDEATLAEVGAGKLGHLAPQDDYVESKVKQRPPLKLLHRRAICDAGASEKFFPPDTHWNTHTGACARYGLAVVDHLVVVGNGAFSSPFVGGP